MQSRAIHEDWQAFFEAQGVQAPVDFRTDWLKVGHLDEILSFVPAKSERGWIAVLASPRLGLELLQKQPHAYELACCFERSFQYRYVFQFYARKTLGMGLLAYNEEVARRILGPDTEQATSSEPGEMSVKGILMKHLGLSEDEIVELPVLFINDEEAPINTWAARALTPNVVNMAVVGSRCLVPDPVIPAFRAATEIPGCDVQFIPAWSPFHELGGGIHCATQVVRALPGSTQR